MDRFLSVDCETTHLKFLWILFLIQLPFIAWLIQMLFIRGFVYFAESVPVPGGSVGLNKTSVHTCRHKRSPLWCLLYKPLYKWVKHQDAGGLCTLEASPLFSHSACRRDSSRRRDGGENDAPPREKCSNRLHHNVVLLFFFCVAWGCSPPRPLSSALLPRYQQTPLWLLSAGLYLRRPP